ncbi:MAG: YceI family protein, partial [Pseudomonadota bacterium]
MIRLARTLAAAGMLNAASVATAEPKEWTLDLGHAYVGWEIDHMNLSPTVGQFRTYDGTFLIDEFDPANSQITFSIEAASLDSNHIGRDNH